MGCRRASVTTALHRIEESGLINRRADGTWLLHGSPPDELAHVQWKARAGNGDEPDLSLPISGP